MTDQGANWTAEWVAKRLEARPEIEEVGVLAPQVLSIVRKTERPFLTATIASLEVEPSTFEHLLDGSSGIEFVANIPKGGTVFTE